jgi:DNA-binding NarL/FixJ family response regulator
MDAPSLLAQATELEPDVILLDWELPGNSITALVETIRKSRTPCKVIVLARRPEARQAALTVGADAFVSKTDPADSLLETLHQLFNPLERDIVSVSP